MLFYITLALNVIVMSLGSYWVFHEKPPFECAEEKEDCTDFCNEGVYVASIILLIMQYSLYVATPVYICITVSCNFYLRAQELE